MKKNLVLILLFPAVAGQALAQGAAGMNLSEHGQAALEALSAGLADEASLEDSHFAGLKAEAALQGLKLESRDGPVQAAEGLPVPKAGGFAVLSQEGAPSEKAGTEPPPPANPAQPEKKGILNRAFGKMTTGVRDFYSRQCKVVRVAILLGLMAAEVGTMLFPFQAIAVVAEVTAALALFGTTRELIHEFRRNRKQPPPPPPAPGGAPQTSRGTAVLGDVSEGGS